MKILKVELSEQEQNQIFDSLIERFDLNKSDTYENGHEIDFNLTDEIEVWSKLELYAEGHLEEDTNAGIMDCQYVNKFEFDLFIDGESIEYVLSEVNYTSKIDGKNYMKRADDFEERISKHYRI